MSRREGLALLLASFFVIVSSGLFWFEAFIRQSEVQELYGQRIVGGLNSLPQNLTFCKLNTAAPMCIPGMRLFLAFQEGRCTADQVHGAYFFNGPNCNVMLWRYAAGAVLSKRRFDPNGTQKADTQRLEDEYMAERAGLAPVRYASQANSGVFYSHIGEYLDGTR